MTSIKVSYFIGVFGLFTMLAGCVSSPTVKHVPVAPGIFYKLTLPPAELQKASLTQLVEMKIDANSHSLIAQVEFFSDKIVLAAMSVEGMPLFDVSWYPQQKATINQYVPMPNIDINYVISDIQWAHWPIEILRESFTGEGVEVSQESKENGNWVRIVESANGVIFSVEKNMQAFQINHLTRHYQVNITNLSRK